jgi:hypothetical protein
VRKYLNQHAGENIKAIGTARKKGGKRRHHKHRREPEDAAAAAQATTQPEQRKQHFIIELFSSALNWCIENASMPNTSQLTALCMALMVITNIYIASKMAGVDKQLNQLSSQPPSKQQVQQQNEYYYQKDVVDDNNSLWKLLSKLDPDARKEDLKFVHHKRPPVEEQSQQHHNKGRAAEETEQDEFDENLEFSQIAKNKLDKQMLELEKMIQKAGQSMEQVTQVVQSQRQRILNPEWK